MKSDKIFSIGDRVRHYLKEQDLSVPMFARKSGLPEHTIINIIHNKSKKKEKLRIIAKYLKVPLGHLLCDRISRNLTLPTSCINPELTFDTVLYTSSLATINELCQKYNIHMAKDQMEDYAHDLYLYHHKVNARTDLVKAFAEGMLQISLKNMILFPVSKEKDQKQKHVNVEATS